MADGEAIALLLADALPGPECDGSADPLTEALNDSDALGDALAAELCDDV